MASPESDFGFLPHDNLSLPPQDHIMAMCRKAKLAMRRGAKHDDPDLRGIPLSSLPGGPIVAWVKFAADVTIYEALTQDWVAKELQAMSVNNLRVPRLYAFFSSTPTTDRVYDWVIGHIVMEYFDAPDCTEEDVNPVAEAVQTLISIRGPSSAPGHIGGGPVLDSFFVFDMLSPFIYKSVKELHPLRVITFSESSWRSREIRWGGFLRCSFTRESPSGTAVGESNILKNLCHVKFMGPE
ncbi:hypothetical protein M413DRAFT_31747 [Hebeloma cylindrosporum]|uniref:Aminoglycoside phosphotransferase domain-containing protein n=1 Tax=Hebeloma cylindrosporum TaxID=76867 RepID=A0A0C2Y5J5_HEBCY|nr:hypothetical protein M413DRAFT_31747 [Hebeloma cylindrosporum h7]